MTSELRVAIVGTGSVARLHAEAVAGHPHARIVAVMDQVRCSAVTFAQVWKVRRVYDDLDRLLASEHPDVVLICTPPAAHYGQVLASLAAGAHVVVEKPPAASLDQLDHMRAAATAAGRQFAVVFQQRTGTAAAHARSLLREGALGRPLIAVCHTLWYRDDAYFDQPWRGRWATEGGGTTLGHGIHQIDLLAYLLGDWATVQGRLWRADRDIEAEDVSTATVTFATGAIAQITTSAVSPRETSLIRIDTQKATITVDHLYGHGHENWTITKAPHIDGEEAATWVNRALEERSGHTPLLRDIFNSLWSGKTLPEVARHPARSFEIVAAIYASAAAGGAVITPATLHSHPTHRTSLVSPVTEARL